MALLDHAIKLLQMEESSRRSMTTPNSNTITEHAATENSRIATDCMIAAQMLRGIRDSVEKWAMLRGLLNFVEKNDGPPR